MTINIERLKTDRAYWDSVAPEGATHYDANDGEPECPWMRLSAEYGWEAWNSDRKYWIDDASGDDYAAAYIPRPAKKWSGPEDGLPPVGVEFEFSLNGMSWDDRVMLFNDGISCLMALKNYPASRWHYKCDDSDIRCRPLKTEKERVVEAVLASGALHDFMDLDEIAEALYDAGALKMPGGE
ncbi:hypothetical protein [Alcanivorax sp. DP30]|uniref:hypothetical protein n=1 Tax=Alcanivorax sp. DP30 TaxID=2606217 RepID=UPI001371EEF8|nr:hypothetical protein [Alcanivorax sp. DP30]MZR63817.1 hypothetical protein [Alcanivorax sp. DP30]